ncbi:MAG TPA: PAS domain-containing protein, partial [Alphaproteobacteria bacterium]|nr:PAS domain-containing protein [Alphaproteobacteria bacterium]
MHAPSAHLTAAHSRPKAGKASIAIFTYIACPVLLVISAYGFWQWSQIPTLDHLLERDQIFFLLSLAVMPLVLFLFLSVITAQRIEHTHVAGSYQTRIDQLQKRLNAQEDFLHSMTDHNPESIAIFDTNNNYWFVNRAASVQLGADPNDIIGKSLAKIVGIDKARKLELRLNQVRQSGQSVETLDQVVGDDKAIRFIQSHFEALAAFGEF